MAVNIIKIEKKPIEDVIQDISKELYKKDVIKSAHRMKGVRLL